MMESVWSNVCVRNQKQKGSVNAYPYCNGDRICFLDGGEIGASVISAGLALDCPRYLAERYTEFEVAEAREAITLPGYCL